MKDLVLISDSTGDLGERLLRALMSQFPKNSFSLRVFRFISNERDLKKILQEIVPLKPIVFHTTLLKDFKKKINRAGKTHKFRVHDITGATMDFLEKSSRLKSRPNSQGLHELNEEYDQRIAALNYTVEHDDGIGKDTWRQADIILCGVSRTSKTPTSIYLANKGYKVANIPIVNALPIPPQLLELPRLPIIGLTINADRLQEVRTRRAQQENIPGMEYADLDEIRSELRKAQSLFSELQCPVIDVTQHAIEEVAALIQNELPKIKAQS